MSRHSAVQRTDWIEDDDQPQITEPKRARRRRMDAKAADRQATEIDRSSKVVCLERAAKRLRCAHASERVLSVPQWNMDKAAEAMRRAGVSGVVTNLCGTRKRRVSAKGY